MSGPLAGVRVVEYAQYVAGPLCGVLLADLGADVVKVEPPTGDGYRGVMPVAPGLGRYFLPLNRGKRSVVLDLKTEDGLHSSARLSGAADVVLHNYPPPRAESFGLDWPTLHARAPQTVAGVVTSFGSRGPLAAAPAYDLVAQARSGLLTSHASPGDRVPVRAGGIPVADLTAGFLLSSAVLAGLLRARESGIGELVEVSLLEAALAVQLQDLVWLEGEDAEPAPRLADRRQLDDRAAEIAGGVAMNPYYRCFETADGFVAVACLNLAQRRAFLGLFGLEDATVDAPDLVPDDPSALAAKKTLTAEIERRISERSGADWLERFADAGVPAGPVLARESVHADPQVVAQGLVAEVEQPGLGSLRLLAPFLSWAAASTDAAPAPELGADTDAVLAELV
jgi:crotonobetainyl-CoA:carnitine CoA-transferase CaiB-like acyl-CoA transferase